MSKQVALLRGINVGGNKKVDMAGLRTLMTDLGHTDVKTLLNSGNVVFDAKPKPKAEEADAGSAEEPKPKPRPARAARPADDGQSSKAE